jgi:hypothetical protein
MKPLSKTMKANLAAALLFASVPPLVQGRDARGGVHITGSVICAKCDLNEVRSTQASADQLYQFTHAQGSLVIRVWTVNDAPSWRYFGWPSEIAVRARDEVFQQLIAEENLFKGVELEGALSTTRALDIFAVRITG